MSQYWRILVISSASRSGSRTAIILSNALRLIRLSPARYPYRTLLPPPRASVRSLILSILRATFSPSMISVLSLIRATSTGSRILIASSVPSVSLPVIAIIYAMVTSSVALSLITMSSLGRLISHSIFVASLRRVKISVFLNCVNHQQQKRQII